VGERGHRQARAVTAIHECPAPTCTRRVASTQLACRSHWYALPKELRDRVWDAHTGRSDEDHSAVIMEAVDWLREKYPA
jgi:hypothetical protein